MRIAELMTTDPNCCLPSTSARMAANLLRQFHVGMLPVVDDLSNRRLVGVVTDRDLCVKVLGKGCDPDEVAVEQCMTRDPVWCSPDAAASDVLSLMTSRHVRRIPVVDPRGGVRGLVSIADLVVHKAITPGELFEALTGISTWKAEVRARASNESRLLNSLENKNRATTE